MKTGKIPICFYLISSLILLILLGYLLSYSKADSFLLAQLPHNSTGIGLLSIITEIANGTFILVLVVQLAIFVHLRSGLTLLLAFLMSGLTVQTLKNTIFKEEGRPVTWFAEQGITLNVPEGLNPHTRHSFPSGHSASAAALCAFFAWRSKRKFVQIALALSMAFVAYTRIYLFHHFPVDVFAGLCIGLIAQVMADLLGNKWFSKPYFSKQLLRR